MRAVTVTTGAIRHTKLRSNRHHQQTITQRSYGPGCPRDGMSPNQQCQSTEGRKGHHKFILRTFLTLFLQLSLSTQFSQNDAAQMIAHNVTLYALREPH